MPAGRENKWSSLALTLAIGSWIFLGVISGGCGSSGDGDRRADTKDAGQAQSAEAVQIRREMEALRKRHPAGNCGEGLLVNSNATCNFARNVHNVFYGEAGLGSGAIFPYNPRIKRDQKILCTPSPPHKCTGGKVVVYFP